MPLTTIMTTKAGVKRAWEMMGMRVHLQNTADFTTIASGATDVREFMASRERAAPPPDGGQAVGRGPRRRDVVGVRQRGRPRPCSARMFRLISVVPPAMVACREEVRFLAQWPAQAVEPQQVDGQLGQLPAR